MSDEAKAKLQVFWKMKQYLVIDEYSMLSKTFLATLSRNIGIGKKGSDTGHDGHSFGGINVIMCGDLHQFPPVAQKKEEYLYSPPKRDLSMSAQVGHNIYQEFQTVVILKQQMRVTDTRWHELLTNLRYGRVTESDISTLRSLIIGSPNCSKDDLDKGPWADAVLVTPRHSARIQWNERATRKMCAKMKRQLFVCPAEDMIDKRPATLRERYCIAQKKSGNRARQKKELPWTVELAIGMKVLVTSNLETDLDLTNGARGEIVDIILHADEPPIGKEAIVKLQRLPAYILVKMARTRATRLEGLEECVIPVEPMEQSMEIPMRMKNGKHVRRTVKRRQFPVTGAYAFTDYRAQGQTITYIIVDIASPPHGTLSLFNLYVALSRSSGQDTIRILRNFDDNVIREKHDEELLAEDDRLELLNEKTKQWWNEMQSTRTKEGV
jgi:hypothetical protein